MSLKGRPSHQWRNSFERVMLAIGVRNVVKLRYPTGLFVWSRGRATSKGLPNRIRQFKPASSSGYRGAPRRMR